MPEFLTLLPPDDARTLLLSRLSPPAIDSESINVISSLDRFTASDVFAPHPLPDFPRTTVDGYAVRAKDTFGASDSLPAYLSLIGEVPMGDRPSFDIGAGQCALIHTGGMLPNGADAVVMIEYTQAIASSGLSPGKSRDKEIEIYKSVADGENTIRIGEDVAQNQLVLPKGMQIRPAEIGGLMALGFTSIEVAKKPRVGLISTGDEVIDPRQTPRPGQVRDINSYTLGALV
ncbi:MAG TPA: molybdopterin molybdenumtransferase MoeA, partial [Anaerolineales bacterium]|nr:molybdopterin molybdenumtransferase MoeA [Anaerolineales bacterium]